MFDFTENAKTFSVLTCKTIRSPNVLKHAAKLLATTVKMHYQIEVFPRLAPTQVINNRNVLTKPKQVSWEENRVENFNANTKPRSFVSTIAKSTLNPLLYAEKRFCHGSRKPQWSKQSVRRSKSFAVSEKLCITECKVEQFSARWEFKFKTSFDCLNSFEKNTKLSLASAYCFVS